MYFPIQLVWGWCGEEKEMSKKEKEPSEVLTDFLEYISNCRER